MKTRYNVVLLAGGRAGWLKEYAGTDIRALAPVSGSTMLEYITDALKKSGRTARIMLAADAGAMQQLRRVMPEGTEICAAGNDLPSSCLLAAKALQQPAGSKILFVCDDIPLLTPEAVCSFLDACEKYPDGELFYPVIPREICVRDYPEAVRTYGHLADGVFTGGNMMLVAADVIPRGQEMAKDIFSRRKQPLKLCSWLGWSFVLKLLLHLLDTKEAEQRTSELLKMKCHVIICSNAEVGMDVDKLSDLCLAEKYLARRNTLL